MKEFPVKGINVDVCEDCPFFATDVDGALGVHDSCLNPASTRSAFTGDYRRAANTYPPEWCGLRQTAVLVQLRED